MASANSSGNGSHVVLIPAVAYFRMSDDKQEASIPAQKKAVEKYAEQHGYRIIREYRDDGIAGWKDTREGFQRLIADLDRGDFQAVLVWDQNRFSRFPPMEANFYWFQLDRAGVHLASCNQGRIDWHSIAGWLTASINQFADSQHRHKLSADTKRGKQASAERGNWQTIPPLGYAVQNMRLVPGEPRDIETVQRIFAEYVAGKSLRSIAHHLNADGIRSSRGGMWAPSSVQLLLRNPAYAGTFRHKDIEVRNHHPLIVDRQKTEAVQRLLAERKTKTTPKRDGGGFLFTGLAPR